MSAEPEDPELEEVDLDLDLVSDTLRAERVGRPTTVRIAGEVLHIKHAGAWTSEAMNAASMGNWSQWAEEVIPDKEELGVWIDANLENFQIEAVFQQCGRNARMNLGKPRGPSGSRKRTRRK